ncbi:uncharacterized protein LOC134001023 [Scomber scombrus]|uniref:uncharacterized protein LOC134001023 n=1 Tax=Scomber scombrus TaxID=13677 RepID=UPI002DDAB893|nr:uncharacterized protein LOC134001023 [Scomber scombrus]
MDHVEERLIEEVRKYDHLYNSSSKNYKDCQVASNSWREISRNTGLEVVECMKRWKNLRDKYVRLRKKHATRSGDPGGRRVPAFYPFLSWLAPHVKHRETESNDPKTSSVESTPSSSAESDTSACSSEPSPTEPPRSATPESPSTPQPGICIPLASVPVESPVSRKRKRDQDDQDRFVKQMANLEERLVEVQQRLLQGDQQRLLQGAQQGGDECSRFGQTLADMLRRVPEDSRPEVMCEVYNLVHESRKNF